MKVEHDGINKMIILPETDFEKSFLRQFAYDCDLTVKPQCGKMGIDIEGLEIESVISE